MVGRRIIEKFESVDTTISYTFSLAGMEAQLEQDLRVPISLGVGADYGFDHLGYGVSPKNPGRISIRCIAVESSATNLATEVDEALSECYRIGLGYLYRLEADVATRRRCLARIVATPSVTVGDGWQYTPAVTTQSFNFLQLSDWTATSATTGSQTIDTANESVTVANGGLLPVNNITFRLRNNGTTMAHRPILFNQTTGQYAAFMRNMQTIDEELYLETGPRLAQYSANNAASYSNDYANFAGTDFRLEPGNNTLIVCCGRPHILPWLNTIGDPNFDLEWSFNATYP